MPPRPEGSYGLAREKTPCTRAFGAACPLQRARASDFASAASPWRPPTFPLAISRRRDHAATCRRSPLYDTTLSHTCAQIRLSTAPANGSAPDSAPIANPRALNTSPRDSATSRPHSHVGTDGTARSDTWVRTCAVPRLYDLCGTLELQISLPRPSLGRSL
ncbi:uncharacterized protein TRAVEDRAFT_61280, partial [Trametes versicolor FP-101664 SS1]|uniref:uncharacterized protein n=1 Tax=Trametes versicolor (strain FP-101664) TaxID=717944 RepID=UPI0004622399